MNIRAVDPGWIAKAWVRQNRLTKPTGALGCLEEIGVRLAAIQQSLRPKLGKGAVIVCAADHGVTAEGVSAYPGEVTGQMVQNFLSGGAAINQIVRVNQADVYVLDVGVKGCVGIKGLASLHTQKIREGTGNIAREPAMTYAQAEQAIQAGIGIAQQAIDQGATILAAGDMGIGNTTVAAALTAALLNLPAEAVTGRGTGVDDAAYRRKLSVVQQSRTRAEASLGDLTQADPLKVLAELGGLEIAAIVGVYLGGAEAGVPCVLDGFPVTAGAQIACRINPNVRDYLFAGHCSVEPGHKRQLEALNLNPILQLKLRLGEGTGAVLGFPILRTAAALISGMATFEEAGVST